MNGNTTIKGRGLPVLDAVHNAVVKAGVPQMKRIVFVCVQHLLHTSTILFEKLIQLGAEPNNIFLAGKSYSYCEEVASKLIRMGIQLQPITKLNKFGEYSAIFKLDVSNMWEKVQNHIKHNRKDIDCVVVLDDGGRCLELISKNLISELPVVGIEQTTAGLLNPVILNLPIPFIDVATCAAKIYLESGPIVDVILQKINKILSEPKKDLRCGVIGLGVIGKSVLNKLMSSKYEVFAYDNNEVLKNKIPGAIYCESIEDIFKKSNFIFGCTGRDVTSDINFSELINEDKTLLSCTSEDKEFLSLLKTIQASSDAKKIQDPLKDINFKFHNGNSILLVKGGFPINFDDSGMSVGPEKIQLTRGLLLSSLIQAIVTLPFLIKEKIKGRVMLHPICQKFVVEEWFKVDEENTINGLLTKSFSDIDWITENSKGAYFSALYLEKCFISYESARSKVVA